MGVVGQPELQALFPVESALYTRALQLCHSSPMGPCLFSLRRSVSAADGDSAQGAPQSLANTRQEEQLVPNPPSQAPHTPAAVLSTASDQSALSQH
ncbi:hypothetical protein AAFF_G00279700 [Aldrovandia affinis]|uniref:Uncharacterized protein n=1 Tax=Aldrovandia affinis TaxID=143900 RepID=A0AAD7WS46_9TELE|nr:hypothetical protein AAFF_G00279700 [Aldrovandia affinis]